MALDFPSSPTVGQLFNNDTGRWQWNGTAWVLPKAPLSTLSLNRLDGSSATGSTTVYVSRSSSAGSTGSTSYASVTYVNAQLANYQPLLVSGTNIKTVNNNSLVGSGNVDIPVFTTGKAIAMAIVFS